MHSAEKISIPMTPDMLRDSVEAGEYASTSEAVRDAVRVWLRQRLEDAERLNAIRARAAFAGRPAAGYEFRRGRETRLAKLHADAVTAHAAT